MGFWNTEINGNDTTLDIYSNFFDKYNNGGNPDWVSTEIKAEFADYFSDADDRNNALFGLALAQWETKSLEPEIFKEIKEIVDNETDLKLWQKLGANENTIEKRKTALKDFLKLISTDKPKAKRRVRPKFELKMNELIRISTDDGTKEFRINEEFVNGKYRQTSSILEWKAGGGFGVMYFKGKGKKVSAKWIDNNNLEIIHDPIVIFMKKENKLFFCGDEVKIEYKTE